MLAVALEEEVNGFLRRSRYQRSGVFRGHRNGYHPLREVTVGLGPVEVRVPRVTQGGAAGISVPDSDTLPAGIRYYEEAVYPALS